MKPMIARDVIEELRKLFPEIPECVARIELVVDCADSTTPQMKIDFRPQNAVDAECKEVKITAKSNLSLSNRADGVDGHYCIKRMKADGITAEFYNANIDEFEAFGTVYYSREAAEKKLADIVGSGTELRKCSTCGAMTECKRSGSKGVWACIRCGFRIETSEVWQSYADALED